MVPCMATEKVTITLDRRTAATARECAKDAHTSLSAWLDEAARLAARRQRAATFAAWEREHIDPDFMAEADAASAASLPNYASW
jgi:hypothetical protein